MSEKGDFIKQIQKLSDDTAYAMIQRDLDLASNPVPVEQIIGDLARKGHQVARVIALDPYDNRLFFEDRQGNHLFAEFNGFEKGYSLLRIGLQGDIAKEYDVQDLEPEPRSRTINRHDEGDYDDSVGARPQGNPGSFDDQKPDMVEDDDAPEHVRKSLAKLNRIMKDHHDDDDEDVEKIAPLAAAAAGAVVASKDKKK